MKPAVTKTQEIKSGSRSQGDSVGENGSDKAPCPRPREVGRSGRKKWEEERRRGRKWSWDGCGRRLEQRFHLPKISLPFDRGREEKEGEREASNKLFTDRSERRKRKLRNSM